MQLGLVHNPPAARSVAAADERRTECETQVRLRERGERGRPRADVQPAVDDLRDPVRRRVDHVLVGRPAGWGLVGGHPMGTNRSAVTMAMMVVPWLECARSELRLVQLGVGS